MQLVRAKGRKAAEGPRAPLESAADVPHLRLALALRSILKLFEKSGASAFAQHYAREPGWDRDEWRQEAPSGGSGGNGEWSVAVAVGGDARARAAAATSLEVEVWTFALRLHALLTDLADGGPWPAGSSSAELVELALAQHAAWKPAEQASGAAVGSF
jgi:hypothetical protein